MAPHQHFSRRAFLGLSASAAALGLTACNPAVTGGDQASRDTGVLNVGQISDSVAFFPLYVAEEKGYFEAEGVTLGERPRLGTGAKLAAALKSGSIDLGAGVLTDAFNLADIQDDAQLSTALVNEYYVDIIVSADFDGPDVDAPLEDRIRALQGKNIGITGPGSGTEALLVYLFAKVGLDPATDATLVNLGAAATGAVGAMQAGRVDALSFFQPVGQICETEGAGSIYISPQRGDIPDLSGAVHGVVFGSAAVMEAKKEQVAGFNRAIDQALAFIEDDTDGMRELLQAYLKQSDPQTVDALVPIVSAEMARDHRVDEEGYAKAAVFHQQSGLAEDPPPFGDFVHGSAA